MGGGGGARAEKGVVGGGGEQGFRIEDVAEEEEGLQLLRAERVPPNVNAL